MNLTAIREKLAAESGQRYWRCLEELADDPEFEALLRQQFPSQVTSWADVLDRRKFLTLMGASLALAGLTGCGVQPPAETIMPYVRSPERLTPGVPLFFATAATIGESTVGLLVESHEGRPTKIEGNPDHPASRGATDIFAQAEILNLYDPDRSQAILSSGEISTWGEAVTAIRAAINKQRDKQGDWLALPDADGHLAHARPAVRCGPQDISLSSITSVRTSRERCARRGAELAFGRHVNTVYHFDRADVILSLGADFLLPPGNLTARPRILRSASSFRRRARCETSNDEPALRRRMYAEHHWGQSRSSLGNACAADRIVRSRGRRRTRFQARTAGRGRDAAGSGGVDRRARSRFTEKRIAERRRARGSAAADRPRTGPCDECGAGGCGNDRDLHRSDRSPADEFDVVACRFGPRHG